MSDFRVKGKLYHVDMSSLARVNAKMNLAVAKIIKQSRAGIIAAGAHILGVALVQTPKDQGPLQASGTVMWDKSPTNNNNFEGTQGATEQANTKGMISEVKTVLRNNLFTFDVAVGFGASYAVFVHENMENNHPNGGNAKFLQNAMISEKKKVLRIIRDHVK